MEFEAAEFEVNFTRKFIVKALNPLVQPHILTLSNLDLLSGRFPVTYFYFYPKKPHANDNITESFKSSLAKTLDSYYPFAGRIVINPSTNEPEIMCDNTGALVLEARANIPLNTLNFYDLDQSLRVNKLVSIYPDIPLQIQVTYYTCGGVSITFTFDHALGDASSFGKFLLSWSEIARNKPISCVPDHQRRLRISARNPPRYHSSLDQSFVKCTMEEIMNIPTTKPLVKRLYFINNSSINQLQSQACRNGKNRTKIEAVSAYVWKTMVRANISSTCKTQNTTCKMGWLVDGRSRLHRRDHNNHNANSNMSNYIGNVLSLAFGEASVNDLKKGSISDVASMVREAISKVAESRHLFCPREECFRLLNWTSDLEVRCWVQCVQQLRRLEWLT
ncbi:coniferyl alcohol acyltransferase isoform X2 [Argentina anserina]|uniref:coniferyl alcohol acyltransferase isoform X2 n=1 Tax=Argentina anserina TaxID=57926 RepID=UPI002176244E|nr:coniferyl alcohol acyltransferase isoform X2 [Potentilla anserina]